MSGTADGVLVAPIAREAQVYRAAQMLSGLLPWRDPDKIDAMLVEAFCDPHSGVMGAYHDSRLIGAGVWARQPWSISAYSLHMGAVLPEYRGRGIGRILVERRLCAITMASAGRDVWVDAATRCPARLERHGFRPVDRLPDGLTRMTLRLPRLPRPVEREVAA